MPSASPAILSAFIALLVVTGPPRAAAQDYPARPITIVVPFAAGGASDLVLRTFIDTAPQFLGQPVVVQLRPGGGGAIASDLVARAKPDGYTLLFGHSNSNSILPAIEGRSKGPDDLVAVCRVNTSGTFLLVAPDAPFATFSQMITWARANPNALVVANTGPWSAVDFTWKRMERELGIALRIVTYPGGAEALVALLGGHVQAALLAPPQSLPHVRAGRLRALAWSGASRHRDLPAVPTAAEQGFDKTLSVFKGVMAPPGTPRATVERIADGFMRMVSTPQAIDGIRQLGDDIGFQGPDEFAAYWRREYETFLELARLFKR